MPWKFDNSYARLPEPLYRKYRPTPVTAPQVLIWNETLAADLGLTDIDETARAQVFGGNQQPPGSDPLAQAYAGHQFGHFTMLGDGRAILLGEQLTPQGLRFDIQLKGSGPTPFSRNGDGRAALGPMLREYIISEAMHALRIPTTRSLAVVTTGEPVYREEPLAGAVLTRVAKSHIRVGTFEYVAALEDLALLKQFADYTINRHYPACAAEENPYLALLNAFAGAQTSLIAKWMAVGFIHGVMNTDNMALAGETIDYGPCAFLDEFDPGRVFSSIDRRGRYAFGNQVSILQWNLARFAETLIPLVHENSDAAVELASASLSAVPTHFADFRFHEMGQKLGLTRKQPADLELIEEWLGILATHRADYTNSFYALTIGEDPEGPIASAPEYISWKANWRARVTPEGLTIMKRHNPSVIPRNYLVAEALQKAQDGDLTFTRRLLAALRNPFTAPDEFRDFRQTPPPNPDFKTFCGT